jgi:hypothetical protein
MAPPVNSHLETCLLIGGTLCATVSEAPKQTGGGNERLDLECFEAEREATLAHDRAVILLQ